MITTPWSKRRFIRPRHWTAGLALLLTAFGALAGSPAWDVRYQRVFTNPEAVIPPQCYTRTEGRFNPCYTCHQTHPPASGRPNLMDDAHLQGVYAFSEVGIENHWSNLFVDRRAAIAAIPDAEIRAYVAIDNYTPLIETLRSSDFRGWIPDLDDLAYPERAFDREGRARDGSGWIAFQYKPLPSTFWPTNGSIDDVMIRLPPAFRQDAAGRPSWPVYLANLSMLEAAIKGMDADLYRRLRPHVCALPVSRLSPINVNTLGPDDAPLLVMLTDGKLGLEAARGVIARRPVEGWADTTAFWSQSALTGVVVPQEAREQVTVLTRFFDLRVDSALMP